MIGIWNEDHASQLVLLGLIALQHRGQESAGVSALNTNGEINTFRGPGLVNEVFNDQNKIDSLPGNAALGDVGYKNIYKAELSSIQPLSFRFTDGNIAAVQYGNLTNAESLRVSLEKEGAIFQSQSDAEILMHLIRRSHAGSLHEQVMEGLNQIKGGFSTLLLTSNELVAAVDPLNHRPLSVGILPGGGYVVASETSALNHLQAEFQFDIEPGEVIFINEHGIDRHYYTDTRQQAIDAMEYVYFARPDSNLLGSNVHEVRKKSGEILAQEQPCPEADICIGVPNSSLSAASGFAEASGIPYEMGLIKNQYIARTFIKPTQEQREKGVQMKLSPVSKVIEGKKLVIVDDSIVRGTTSRRIVQLLKDNGAKEVHVRISAPPLRFPNFYGNDGTNPDDLIAKKHSIEEIRDILGADSLGYISEEGLVKSIGLNSDEENNGVFMGHFNGNYPTELYDYQDVVDYE